MDSPHRSNSCSSAFCCDRAGALRFSAAFSRARCSFSSGVGLFDGAGAVVGFCDAGVFGGSGWVPADGDEGFDAKMFDSHDIPREEASYFLPTDVNASTL